MAYSSNAQFANKLQIAGAVLIFAVLVACGGNDETSGLSSRRKGAPEA
jgi:hypothetical protein